MTIARGSVAFAKHSSPFARRFAQRFVLAENTKQRAGQSRADTLSEFVSTLDDTLGEFESVLKVRPVQRRIR